MWIIIWKNVFDSWSPWPGPRGCFGALSALKSKQGSGLAGLGFPRRRRKLSLRNLGSVCNEEEGVVSLIQNTGEHYHYMV